MKSVIVGHIIDNKNLVAEYLEAEKYLEKHGIEPVNPSVDIMSKGSISSIVSAYIDLMDRCDAIFFTRSWVDCPCARIINSISMASKKKVIYHDSIDGDMTTIINQVIRSIEDVTGFFYSDIIDVGRQRKYHLVRLIMVNLLESRCSLSNIQVKGIINRYNLPVTYYLKKFKNEMRYSKEFRAQYEDIVKNLNRIVSQ